MIFSNNKGLLNIMTARLGGIFCISLFASLYMSHVVSAEIDIEDQEAISSALLCQSVPQLNNHKATDFGELGIFYFYGYYFEKTKNLLARNAQGITEEIIDYSPHTTYKLKEPIVMGGISFDTLYTVDIEDGGYQLSAIKTIDEKDNELLEKLPKQQGFYVNKHAGKLILSCFFADLADL